MNAWDQIGHSGSALWCHDTRPQSSTISRSRPRGPITHAEPGGAGHPTSTFDLWYSRDGGESWSLVDGAVTMREVAWTVPLETTERGMLELVANDEAGVMGSWLTNLFDVIPGSTAADDVVAPDRLALRVAGNPSREAALQFGRPARGDVEVRIYDARGALVRQFARGSFGPGWHHAGCNGTDAAGLSGAARHLLRAGELERADGRSQVRAREVSARRREP